MSTVTNIRLEVNEELYNSLLNIQSVLRQKTGKKPALATIIVDIVNRNIADETQACEGVLDSFYQSRSIPLAYNGRNTTFSSWRKNIQKKENALFERERVVLFKEENLAVREISNREDREQFDNMKFEQLEYKHAIENKEYVIELLKKQIGVLEAKNTKLQAQIEKLKERKTNNNQVFLNGSSNSIWEFIKPLLLPFAAIAVSYLLGKNADKTTFSPEFKQFVPYLEKLSDDQKKDLGLYLEGMLKNS